MDEKWIDGIIRTIAERHGTSSTEVRAELDVALSAAEPNAPVQQGEILTQEDALLYAISRVAVYHKQRFQQTDISSLSLSN